MMITNNSLPLFAAGATYFFLDEKVGKKSRQNEASSAQAKHPARRSVIPPLKRISRLY